MSLFSKLYSKTEQARAREKIRPLLESRMMRDIVLEVSQRGTERLDPQSVPLAKREQAARLASECGAAGLRQSTVEEIRLDPHGVTLVVKGEPAEFLYADYNYEDIEDTECLPAVAQYLVQHLQGYYTISRSFHAAPCPKKGKPREEHTQTVFIRRHVEDTPFDPKPLKKQKLF